MAGFAAFHGRMGGFSVGYYFPGFKMVGVSKMYFSLLFPFSQRKCFCVYFLEAALGSGTEKLWYYLEMFGIIKCKVGYSAYERSWQAAK